MCIEPKISIVTVCLNSAQTLEATLSSLYMQTFQNFEHVIVDGGSTDNTMEIISRNKWPRRTVVSEPDKGVYDAFNRGLDLCSGKFVGFLNADDTYANNMSLQKIADHFTSQACDAMYADLHYVSQKDGSKILRKWTSGEYTEKKLLFGWMPPHPTFYCSKDVISLAGGFDDTLEISADYKLMLQILRNPEYKVTYLREVVIKMQAGGLSNTKVIKKMQEDYQIIEQAKLLGLLTLISKNVRKLHQFC